MILPLLGDREEVELLARLRVEERLDRPRRRHLCSASAAARASRRSRCATGSGTGAAASSERVYGCSGASMTRVDRAGLHHPAPEQHRHPVRDVPDQRQVVGDEQVADPEFALQSREQVEHLRLYGQVERAGRLVADDQPGPQHQRPGDGDALALAAGELARVAVGGVRVQADAVQGCLHLGARGRRARPAMGDQRFHEGLPDRTHGVQRSVRVLEDDLDLAGQLAPAPAGSRARCPRRRS